MKEYQKEYYINNKKYQKEYQKEYKENMIWTKAKNKRISERKYE